MKLIKSSDILEDFLKAAYPNQLAVFKELFGVDYEYFAHTVHNEFTMIHCDSEEEARAVFEKFPHPETKGYAVLFGPVGSRWEDFKRENPFGAILDSNT